MANQQIQLSCQKEYETELLNGSDLAGEWYVETGIDGEVFASLGHQLISTYNTAAEDGSIWLDDHGHIWPMKGKTGAVRLALLTGAPLIPFAQWGAQQVMPPYKFRFYLFPRKTMQVNVGKPMDLTKYQNKQVTEELLTAATEELMQEIANLLADLRGEVAPTVRKSLAQWKAQQS